MIKIEKIQNPLDPIITKVVTDPVLWSVTNGPDKKIEDYKIDTTFDYLKISRDDVVIGIFRIKAITEITAECHIHIMGEHWGKGSGLEAAKAGFEFLKKETEFRKAFTMVPVKCTHILKLCEKIGWTCCGLIKEGVMFNLIPTDLICFEYTIRE